MSIREAYEKALKEFRKEYGIFMARTRVRCCQDVVILHPDWTLEDFEEEEKQLKEESDKLTEWPEVK